MDIQRIKIDKIFPNDWNPNHLKPELYKKLRRYIEKEAGAVIPLVLRPHPSKKTCYEIIDGFHRWKIFQELKHAEVDAVIIKADDDEAKILSVNLNYMRGQPKPMQYAQLIYELTERRTVDDLELLLPDSKLQLLDKLDLLKLPEVSKDRLEDSSTEQEKEILSTLKVQVTEEQKEAIEGALNESDLKKRGAALARLVRAGAEALRLRSA